MAIQKHSKTSKSKLKGKGLYLSIIVVLAIALAILAFSPSQEVQEKQAQQTPQASQEGKTTVDAELLKSEIFPGSGFQTKIILGNAIPQLVETGVIDIEKFKQLYTQRGGLTDDELKTLTEPTTTPLTLTPDNANFIINLLWPLGIANKNPTLDEMAASYPGVAQLASTGGWTLGKQDAMRYFNKLTIIRLTPEQQQLVEKLAKSTYRPCCNNPSWFPDCNHGAAMLALLELGASQGMSEDELYTLALQANTLWFPQQYLLTATLYESQGKDYFSNARETMSGNYSSYVGWAKNVYQPLQLQGLLPETEGGGSCGV